MNLYLNGTELMSIQKEIPAFKTPKKENEFWQEQDSTEYIDWTKAKKVSFPNLKPSTKINDQSNHNG